MSTSVWTNRSRITADNHNRRDSHLTCDSRSAVRRSAIVIASIFTEYPHMNKYTQSDERSQRIIIDQIDSEGSR